MTNVTNTVLAMVRIMLPPEELYDETTTTHEQALAFNERLSLLCDFINETSFIHKETREAVEKFVQEMLDLAEKKKLAVTDSVKEELRVAVNSMYHSSNYVN
jgi:hypothetical protein